MKHLALAGSIILVAGCLFPATRHLRSISSDIGTYTMERPGRVYGALELREYLPEEGPLFVEFGVDSCLVTEYAAGDAHYRTDLFLFKDTKGAAGLFVFTDTDGQQALEIGYRGRIAGERIDVLKGHYIIRVTPGRGGTRDGAAELAEGIASRIEGGTIQPDIFETLPKQDLVAGSEVYFRGPRAFRERFGDDLLRALEIQYALEGTVATYEPDRHPVELFKIRYPNRESVLSVMDAYSAAHPGSPILHGEQGVTYTTVVHDQQSESYLAEWGDTLYLMRGGRSGGRSSGLFEYILRGGR